MRPPGMPQGGISRSQGGVMGGLIFFAVIIGWFCFCVWLARKIARWIPIKSTITKALVSVAAFALIFPLPVIDEIIGNFQVDKLCREEAGVKIYGKLELGPEFFNADGTANFINPVNGNISERMEPYIEIDWDYSEDISSPAKLSKGRLIIKSKVDNKVLLERIGFGIDGGRIIPYRPRLFLSKCPGNGQRRDELLRQVIIQKIKEK